MNITNYQGLSRTASDNSFLTRTQLIMSRDTIWASTNSNGYNTCKECSLNTKFLSTFNVKQSQNNCLFNSHADKTNTEVRYLFLKKESSTASKRNITSSGPHTTERISSSRLEKSKIKNPELFSGELLLDFPSNCNSPQSLSHTLKKPDKSTELRGHPSLQHSASTPGFIGRPITESKLDFANAKFESKSRPFFPFFWKKHKTSDGRSPSSSVKSNNHQNIQRCPSNLSFTSQLQRVSQRTASPSSRGRGSAGQSPVSPRFYLASVSSNIPCTPSSPPSMYSPSETTSDSPSNRDKCPRHMSRSRSKSRQESQRKAADSEQSDPEDYLTLEDLPLHPSVLKQPLGVTNSNPSTSVMTSSRLKMDIGSNNTTSHRTKVMSEIRRNSLPESHVDLKMKDPSFERCYGPKDCKFDSKQNCRRKSLESSSKSMSGNDSQYEIMCTSHDQKPRPPVRSQSVPSFGSDLCLPGTDTRVISDAEDFEYSPTDMTGSLHLSFCGCGFLGMYHLGVISCLSQRSPSLLEQLERVAGASAGAIMAVLLVTCRDKIE
ncbi:unnamed protein product, partial [Candidula unifasciata]